MAHDLGIGSGYTNMTPFAKNDFDVSQARGSAALC